MDGLASRCSRNRKSPVQEQQKVPSEKNRVVFFGRQAVDLPLVRLVCGLGLVVFFFSAVLFRHQASFDRAWADQHVPLPVVEVESASDLVQQLKSNSLWDVAAPFVVVSPVVVKNFPADMPLLDADTQKRAFLHTLLPVAMVALAEVEEERAMLEDILSRMPAVPQDLSVAAQAQGKSGLAGLVQSEIDFLFDLCRKYKTSNVSQLLSRVNTVPVSLIMAQGAWESSWGGSRFALKGNNIFGVVTWNEGGLIPAGPGDGTGRRYAVYASLLDSVRAYILMLNRVPAYSQMHAIREQSMDPLKLARGLLNYSERREHYIADLARMIQGNQLQTFDQCILATRHQPQKGVRLASLAAGRQ